MGERQTGLNRDTVSVPITRPLSPIPHQPIDQLERALRCADAAANQRPSVVSGLTPRRRVHDPRPKTTTQLCFIRDRRTAAALRI